ncbi:hypothetical protein C8Q72DRAFT_903990 [Fomitopsis betulina]|nr:hypothetical protein C8Q72DRAFT_892343 [Fomitopsis betulina]KAI0715739.1 hypothetical protein C8Q72DRAFT_903990 [Fomitopsis betulina]
MPYAKSIKCLESAHATPADVYLFWLAIMSELEQLFTENRLQLPVSTMEDIRAISNQHFNELINNAPQDIYITAFFLDPRYRNAPIYKNINPLSISSIQITGQPNARSAAPTESPHDAMVKRVGLCLLQLLKNEYGTLLNEKNVKERMLKRNPLLEGLTPSQAYAELKDAVKAYARGFEPFNRPLKTNRSVRDWWIKVQKEPGVEGVNWKWL